jgi:hypothetical protein
MSFCPWVHKFHTPLSQLLRFHPWNICNAAGKRWHFNTFQRLVLAYFGMLWLPIGDQRHPKPLQCLRWRLAKSVPINSKINFQNPPDIRGTNRLTAHWTDSTRMTDRCTGLICTKKNIKKIKKVLTSRSCIRGHENQRLLTSSKQTTHSYKHGVTLW